jgi:alpha-tubulin suppressor-like RCC1 family protein/type II secretory pathway pseudopilin PulG
MHTAYRMTMIRDRRGGFTVGELLIVLAIIVLLAAFIVPVLLSGREKGRQVKCISNQRQIALAILAYAQDHQEVLPSAERVWTAIPGVKPANQGAGILVCPDKSNRSNGYVFQGAIAGLALSDPTVKDSTTVFVTADGQASNPPVNAAFSMADIDTQRHGKQFVASYLDGHASVTTHVSFCASVRTPPQPQASIPPNHWSSLEKGMVLSWGDRLHGVLGDGIDVETIEQMRKYPFRPQPELVKGISGVTAISVGQSFCLALKADGTVWAWGYNKYGQLGDGTTTNRSLPVQAKGLTGMVGIAAGDLHSLAVKQDGTVWAWGFNDCGQLGDGTTTDRLIPAQVPGVNDVVQVGGGLVHSVALKSDGTLLAWGSSQGGKLGGGPYTPQETPIIRVSRLSDVKAIAVGSWHTLALRNDGTVWAWGQNDFSSLGDGTTTNRDTPVQVGGVSGMVAIAAHNVTSMALKKDGTVWLWGNVINVDRPGLATPIQRAGMTGIVSIAVGPYNCLAQKNDGTVWEWGQVTWEQRSADLTKQTPHLVTGLPTVSQVACGSSFYYAVK